jgi:hypothetical protein
MHPDNWDDGECCAGCPICDQDNVKDEDVGNFNELNSTTCDKKKDKAACEGDGACYWYVPPKKKDEDGNEIEDDKPKGECISKSEQASREMDSKMDNFSSSSSSKNPVVSMFLKVPKCLWGIIKKLVTFDGKALKTYATMFFFCLIVTSSVGSAAMISATSIFDWTPKGFTTMGKMWNYLFKFVSFPISIIFYVLNLLIGMPGIAGGIAALVFAGLVCLCACSNTCMIIS